MTTNDSHTERCSVPTVVDQSEIIVPAGWDSLGKILVVKEGFDADAICDRWDMDIHVSDLESSTEALATTKKQGDESNISEDVYEGVVPESEPKKENMPKLSAITMYEESIRMLHPDTDGDEEETSSKNAKKDLRKTAQAKTDFQDFLASQFELLEERIKEEEGIRGNTSPFRRQNRKFMGSSNDNGPIQGVPLPMDINVGGIQIEGVEEVLRRLKIQEMAATNQPGSPSSITSDSTPGASPYGATTASLGGGTGVPRLTPANYDGSTPVTSKRLGGSPKPAARWNPSSTASNNASSPTPRVTSFGAGGGINHIGGNFNQSPTRLTTPPAGWVKDEANKMDPAGTGTGTPATNKSQNEVLANFFQTLLDRRNSSPGSASPGGH